MGVERFTVRRSGFLSSDAQDALMKDNAWAEGLRGLAAALIVSSDIVYCYARALAAPCCAFYSNKPYLFQRPILRLVVSGHSWMAIFFILMGFLNGLRPLQFVKADQLDKALRNLSSSSFGQIFRLVLPATAATVISWLACNFGLFNVSAMSDAFWLRSSTPAPSASWPLAVKDLFAALKSTWVIGAGNPYDQPQWVLVFFVQASVMIISALFLVITMTPRWRSVTLCVLAYCSLNWSRVIGDPYVGLCCFMGIALSELSLSELPRLVAPYSVYLSPTLIFTALVLMSYPASYVDAAPWTRLLRDFGTQFFPAHNPSTLHRLFGSIGGILLIMGILISPHARWLLSRRPLRWLGKVSFAVYILYGVAARTVFAWVLHFGGRKEVVNERADSGADFQVERYKLPSSTFQCAVATLALAVTLAGAASLWTSKLEPLFDQIANKWEVLVTGKPLEQETRQNGHPVLPYRKDRE